MKVTVLLVVLATLAVSVRSQNGLCDFCGPFEVTADTLPDYIDQNPFPFKSYTGYVVANTTGERNLFYWLVESQSANPENDPLVFWYQGGPGCSGLGGLFTEHGPFRVNEDGDVVLAQFSWNKIANVVYLEQPCGVGFSYQGPDDEGKYESNDHQAAVDNAGFIEGFLQAHPEYVGRETWLAGESYGGVYVPTLAAQILSNSSYTVNPQLVGLMVGNPVFSCDSIANTNRDIQMNIFYQRSLISYVSFSSWKNAGCSQDENAPGCSSIYSSARRSIGGIAQEIGSFTFNGTQPSLDSDCLYQDFITENTTLEWMVSLLTPGIVTIDELTQDYLSRADVQQAIGAHAPHTGEWKICGGIILYGQSGDSMIPYYEYIIKERPGFHILVYSGDTDMDTVPAPPTQICLAELNGTPIASRSWQPWFVNGATGGYVEAYEEYTYATVKGAGHTVPQYQPLDAYNMYSRFLTNQNLDGGEIYFPADAKRSHTRQGDKLREHGVGLAKNFPQN